MFNQKQFTKIKLDKRKFTEYVQTIANSELDTKVDVIKVDLVIER